MTTRAFHKRKKRAPPHRRPVPISITSRSRISSKEAAALKPSGKSWSQALRHLVVERQLLPKHLVPPPPIRPLEQEPIAATLKDVVRPWVKEQETLLFADKVTQVLTHLQWFVEITPDPESILHYFCHHQT